MAQTMHLGQFMYSIVLGQWVHFPRRLLLLAFYLLTCVGRRIIIIHLEQLFRSAHDSHSKDPERLGRGGGSRKSRAAPCRCGASALPTTVEKEPPPGPCSCAPLPLREANQIEGGEERRPSHHVLHCRATVGHPATVQSSPPSSREK
jgi:hypothetical protein